MSYSQNDEERYILESVSGIGRAGKFLDIGAYDGKTFSNTLALVEAGWGGVCFEPSPVVYPKLFDLHKDRGDVTTVQKAVTVADSGPVMFYDSGGDAVSTTDTAHRDKWSTGGITFSETSVEAISIADLVRDYGTKWDFVNVDVEGLSADLFMALPDEIFEQAACVCVEHDCRDYDIVQRMQGLGFEEVYRNGENLVMRRA